MNDLYYRTGIQTDTFKTWFQKKHLPTLLYVVMKITIVKTYNDVVTDVSGNMRIQF